MRMHFAVLALGLAIAGCGEKAPPPPRPDTEGTAARARVDSATKTFSDCVTGHADTVPVSSEAAGSIALDIMKSCEASRDALKLEVARFHKIGHPNESDAMAEAVAVASVKVIEDELRGNAVVTIVKRQNETPKPETDTKS